MATPNKVDAEILNIIKQNCSLTSEKIKVIIKEKTGMDVTQQGINYHMMRIRKEAEQATASSSAVVDAKIEEFIDINTRDYLNFLDENIRLLHNTISGKETNLQIDLDEDTGKMKGYWFSRYSRLMGEHIDLAFRIRPDVATLNVNLKENDDIEAKMKKYEELYK
jgi:hypothetical protein